MLFTTPSSGRQSGGREGWTMSMTVMGMGRVKKGKTVSFRLYFIGGSGTPGLFFCSSSCGGFTTSIGRSNTLEPIGLSKNDDGVRSDANSRTNSG